MNTVSLSQIDQELQSFDIVLAGMELLQDDYLGGSGTRGYGKIAFEGLRMTFKPRTYYDGTGTPAVDIAKDTDITTLRQGSYRDEIRDKISETIPTE